MAKAGERAAVHESAPLVSSIPPLPEDIRKRRLASGVRLVSERMPEVRSVAIGCWVAVGARDEQADLAGASHFLEHLLFKGTARWSAREIAEQVDARGGEMNAFTSKEHTAFYLRLPEDALDWGVRLLGEVLAEPAFRPAEINAERQVIVEEILMSLDDPDDRAHTLFYEALFPGHPAGREVLGAPDTVRAMSREALEGFHLDYYGPENLVVAVAGLVDHDEVAELVASSVGGTAGRARPHRTAPGPETVSLVVEERPTEQAHVVTGWRGLDYHDPDRYALAVANHVLGGGPASRLFQEIREQRGLAYAVFSVPAALTDSGALSIYVGTGAERLAETMGRVEEVVDTFATDGITAEELDVARGFLQGSLLLGLEDSGSRLARLGSSEAIRGEVISIDEHVGRLAAVTRADVTRVLNRVFGGERTTAAVGPFDESHRALAGLG